MNNKRKKNDTLTLNEYLYLKKQIEEGHYLKYSLTI